MEIGYKHFSFPNFGVSGYLNKKKFGDGGYFNEKKFGGSGYFYHSCFLKQKKFPIFTLSFYPYEMSFLNGGKCCHNSNDNDWNNGFQIQCQGNTDE